MQDNIHIRNIICLTNLFIRTRANDETTIFALIALHFFLINNRQGCVANVKSRA